MFSNGFIDAEVLQGYAMPRCKVVLLSAENVICTSVGDGGSEGNEEEDW